MPIDPSIPLSANTQGLDVGKLVSMAQFAHQMRQQQQAEQNQNALKTVLSAPGAFDPQTNTITPKALQSVMQIDPNIGIKLRDDQILQQMKAAQVKHYESENGKMSFDALTGIAGASIDAYDDAKKRGASEPDAIQAATKVRNEGAKNSGGLLSDSDVDKLTNSPFDPSTARTFAGLNKEWSTGRRAETTEAERERHDQAVEANVARGQNIRVETGEAAKWQVLTDPTKKDAAGNPVQYRYNPETGQSTTLDASTPYKPGGAQRIGGGSTGGEFTPEMGGLMAAMAAKGISLPTGFRSKAQQVELYKGILNKYQDKTPDEIADLIKTGQIEFGAQKKETQTAAGVAGKVEVAANEIQAMTPVVLEASNKVPRGSFVPLNKLVQMANTSISDPNLKELKIRINSLLNAYDLLAARGGTDQAKREETRNLLLSADSPEALKAALNSFGIEASVAHEAAVKATKVPELPDDGKAAKNTAPSAKADVAALKASMPAVKDRVAGSTAWKAPNGQEYVWNGTAWDPKEGGK